MKGYSIVNVIRIVLFHLSAFLVFYVGYSHLAFLLFLVTFWIRSFAISGGYHRYFSHRSYQTTRLFQFFLALLGTTAGQKGPLSWVTSHRRHHQYADTEKDPHSPVRKGWLYAHVGWLLKSNALPTGKSIEKEFNGYPEIIFLNRFYSLGFIGYIVGLYLFAQWVNIMFPYMEVSPGRIIVWCGILSTLFILHGTCLINSIGHREDQENVDAKDNSRNQLFLYPIALGENWHHNHHKFPSSANAGVEDGQIDLVFYQIKMLEKLGLVWDVKDAREYLSPAEK